MYHYIVKKIVRDNFNALSKGDYEPVLATSAETISHEFLGESAIGGQRHSKKVFRKWFERLFRLFPSIQFTIRTLLVKGFPNNTRVIVEWSADVTPQSGPEYVNKGVHIIHMKWGRAVKISAYENAELVQKACDKMVLAGIDEAGYKPIS